jgi:hypothetical protein
MGYTSPHHRWTVFKVSTVISTSYSDRHAPSSRSTVGTVMTCACVHLLSTSLRRPSLRLRRYDHDYVDLQLECAWLNDDVLPEISLKTIRSHRRITGIRPIHDPPGLFLEYYILQQRRRACSFFTDMVRNGALKLIKCTGAQNAADSLTKSLPTPHFNNHREFLHDTAQSFFTSFASARVSSVAAYASRATKTGDVFLPKVCIGG